MSVCLPARNEAATVGQVVEVIRRQLMEQRPLVDELVVIDDGSSDGTADVARNAGADVVTAQDVLPEYGTEGGKGQALWKAGNIVRVHVVVPEGFDNPDQPTGGNLYDRRVCAGLAEAGWEVLVADAQKVKGLAPLACKTDKSAWTAAHPGAMKCFG